MLKKYENVTIGPLVEIEHKVSLMGSKGNHLSSVVHVHWKVKTYLLLEDYARVHVNVSLSVKMQGHWWQEGIFIGSQWTRIYVGMVYILSVFILYSLIS